jgi:hypothetical protein
MRRERFWESHGSAAMTLSAVWIVMIAFTGCVPEEQGITQIEEKNGITYYLDGAGNWGFGVADVPAGLKKAGYKGRVENYMWTTSFNPAIDQRNRLGNELRAAGLADKIKAYLKNHPDNDVNIIALSAGTGVAIWTVEKLKPPAKVNNVILLGSSLSFDYDVSKALANMKGMIYVYYSRYDSVLEGPVKAIGTVDGKFGTDAAGLVGLRPPSGSARIKNYGWDRRYQKYGWSGSHTDCTNQAFVSAVLARHILPPTSETPAARPGTSLPAQPQVSAAISTRETFR